MSPSSTLDHPDPELAGVAAPRLGELLVQEGKVSARDIERALLAQQEMGGLLGRVLVRLGLVSELDVAHTLSRQLGLPFVAAEAFPEIMPEVEGLLPEFLQTHGVFPLAAPEGELHVAMATPQDPFILKALRLATGRTVVPHLALESAIERALAEPVEEEAQGEGDGLLGDGLDGGDFVEHLKDLASEAPVIRLVNTIIGRVIDLRASDIHLEPFDDGLHVRYRVDGVIHPGETIPPRL
ncbi:secretion system protein E, partial [Melaminivora alkalimesophila]